MDAHRLSTQWYLFLDSELVERETGFDRRMHRSHKRGPIFPDRQSWEHGPVLFQPIFDGRRFHAIYRVLWPDAEVEAFHGSLAIPRDEADCSFAHEVAYATSEDGIQWERPFLGLCEVPVFQGGQPVGMTRSNNCGVREILSHRPYDWLAGL